MTDRIDPKAIADELRAWTADGVAQHAVSALDSIRRAADTIDALVKERDSACEALQATDDCRVADWLKLGAERGEGVAFPLGLVALREVKAQAWREGWDASERFGYLDGALETPLNPYLEADDDF